ncbi:MAG: hypothetical protein JEZ06_24050 [Anaerolineaceae bacterium]|nr:hypothetical protein [Anaerolineaceae bacterium]
MIASRPDENDVVESFFVEMERELEENKRALNEVNLMLEQSRSELDKLTSRNASISGHLQQVQSQFDTLPGAEIKMAYDAALDAQQRLLVMRSQLEKLQSDQKYLQKLVELFERIHIFSSSEEQKEGILSGGKSQTVVLKKLIDAQESERKRLSGQMHDGPAQALSNFIVQAEIANRLFDLDPTKAQDELNNLKTSALNTFQKVRDFIFDLRPMMLDDLGLFPTIRRYVDILKEKSGNSINLSIQGQERKIEPYLEVMIFRALQEMIGNSLTHNADFAERLEIDINLIVDEMLIRVIINDNGKGFNPETIQNSSGFGLKIIKERVEMAGGNLEIDSAVGHGTRITFQVPSLYSEQSDNLISN